MAEEKKYTSRKFIVWIVATIIFIGIIILSFFTKNETIADQFVHYWGSISLAYIGGNVAQDFIFNKEKK